MIGQWRHNAYLGQPTYPPAKSVPHAAASRVTVTSRNDTSNCFAWPGPVNPCGP